jgi:hypothetical protein
MPSPGNPGQRIAYEGKIRHYFVPDDGLNTPAAPTVAELTDDYDVLDASRYTPKDGLSGDPTQQFIDSTDITETFDAQQMGSWGEQITLQMYKQFPDDDAFDFFDERAYTVMYLVTLWAADEDSPKDGDRAYVRRVEVGQPVPLPHSPNAKQRFTLPTTSVEAPIFNAVVTGGS